jgi:hypothetical protein
VARVGAHGAWRVGSRGAAGFGERGRMKKWVGSGRIDKLGAYVPRPGTTHLIFLSFIIWRMNICRYIPQRSDLAEEHKDPPYVPQLPDLANEHKSLNLK